MNFEHVSVLLNECIEGLNIKSDGVYVDCTLGGGGHSSQIVKRLSDKGMLIGIDQDSNAIAAARGIFSIMEQFDALLAQTIDSTLGLR